jgi:hypothetical protein
MKHRALSWSIAAICLLGVSLVAWWGFQQRVSPGPLHPSHANVAELQGNKGCNACHGDNAIAAGDSLAKACVVCHDLIGSQMARRTGIHGAIDAARINSCETCHREHLGDAMPLVSETAFHDAGIVDPEMYDHAHVSMWLLTGKHDQLTCKQCHPNAEALNVEKGQRRFLGQSQVCTACHDDVHKGELGVACAECHGQERPFKESPLFTHPESFPLRFAHANRLCSECHTTPMVFSGQSLECASCHMDSYDATTKPPHRLAGLGTDCTTCHTSTNWQAVTFTHPASFPLIGPHANQSCASCHSEGAKQQQVMAYVGNHSCVSCHASPHEARFVEIAARSFPNAKDSCAACHDSGDMLWSAAIPRLTPALHAATGFPLTKPHDAQTCAQCHAGLEPGHVRSTDANIWKARFPGREPLVCEACHKDPHAGQFASSPSKGACAACHETTRFFPTAFDAERHAACGFALDGGHRAVACASCHKQVEGVRQFVGVTRKCADCHEDVHKGEFDKPGRPIEVHGNTGCARCHSTSDFQEVAWTSADHGLWTGEVLKGKHAQASCNDCHRRDLRPGQALTKLQPAPKACISCHEDIHAGQFRVEAVNDCSKCHKSMERFKPVTFDHDKDSRFVLDADHKNLACGACHKAIEVAGKSIIRYKPLGTRCADCHDSRPVPRIPGDSTR